MITFRPVSLDNLDSILEIYQQCEDFLALGPAPIADQKMVIADLEHSRETEGNFYGIYRLDEGVEKMVGVVDVIPSGYQGCSDQAYLSLLMIARPFRSQGVGAEVVRKIEAEICSQASIKKILCSVQVNNPDAILFWRRMGYTLVGGPELQADQTVVFHLQKVLPHA